MSARVAADLLSITYLMLALMRIIINHGAMPDSINGLAQVNEAAELYRGPKIFRRRLFFLQPLRARVSTPLFLYRVK